jgi:hypothetical protein
MERYEILSEAKSRMDMSETTRVGCSGSGILSIVVLHQDANLEQPGEELILEDAHVGEIFRMT